MPIIQMSDVWGQVKAHFQFMEDKEFLDLCATLPLNERFRRIRHNYRLYQSLVDNGLASWMETAQYEVGDWLQIFTPIEQAVWHDIRCNGLPLWPQLPVGKFFVDFGNPAVKIALECDGRQWHNPEKDAERDRQLRDMGWVVFRAEGWRCKKVLPYPDDFSQMDRWEREQFLSRRRAETMEGIIDDIRQEFRGLA